MWGWSRIAGRLIGVFHLICVAVAIAPPDVSNITLTIENNVCANKKPFQALLLILSHTGNVKERQLIRDSYPAQEIEDDLDIRRVFILASLNNDVEPNKYFKSVSDKDIQEENDVYSDLIQLNSTEEYRMLTLKSLAAFTWASKNCQHARIIMKLDDNVVFDYYTAAAHWRTLEDDEIDTIRGYIHYKSPPERRKTNWKHYTSVEEFSGSYYPDYTATAYATSPKTLKLLVETSKEVPFLNCEDVYFTGLVASKANVTRTDERGKIASPAKKSLNCCISDCGKVYACEYFLLKERQYYFTSRLHIQKYKNHGRYCYFNKCYPHSKEVQPGKKFRCY